jgi:biopolymer transport protein ExbB
METSTLSLLTLFKMGGVFMWPLLAFSIFTTAIALERGIFILSRNLHVSDMKEKLLGFARSKDRDGATAYLQTFPKRRLSARIFRCLVRNWDLSEHLLEKSVETEALLCISSLERGLNFLVALGSLAPLTGFLGTVSGMVSAFKSIAEATEVNAQIVANGIYEALITTVFGLVIAIVAMIAHSLLVGRVDSFAQDVELTCSDVITTIATVTLISDKVVVASSLPTQTATRKGFWAR